MINLYWTLIILCFTSLQLFAQEIVDSFATSHEIVVYFDSDSYQIPDSSLHDIENLVLKAQSFTNFNLRVHAHTDEVGSENYNKKLSRLRKDAIVDQIRQFGISDTLINSEYHGEQMRIALGSDNLSRQKNRRAVVELIAPRKYGFIKGKVVSEGNHESIKAEVVLTSKQYENSAITDDDGKFRILAPLGEYVVLEFVSMNHFIKSEALKVTRELLVKPIEVPMVAIEIGKRFIFENMLFLGNRSRMLRRSERVLHHLNRFMFANPDVCIEIAGHINLPSSPRVGKETGHYELSVARSLVVKDALLNSGVSEERMLSKGYGNWFMVYPKADTPEKQEENRRVEIIIMHCDSTASLEDDNIIFPDRYFEVPIKRKYNPKTVNTDLEITQQSTRDKLILQLKQMKALGLNPEEYSYQTLISSYPNFPN